MNVEDKLRNAIKCARKSNNMTQTKLAENIGMSKSFICDIEAGRKNPSINTLGLIAKALNISLDKIFLN
ncbi:helix-turn-helix transcriptional regulator [Clostridium novyi]|uniref:helix-turn-helix transcriptional regulator n=1 Tax=Clostridium novyi TaxID=1542 RepID=UPI00057FD4D8|nr:helix-turn-helix transcriptional regulator [Clostridium novyi]